VRIPRSISDNKSTIVLIPIRSGSKGVVDKNIKKHLGYPLFYWSLAAAEYIATLVAKATIVVSSDSNKYLHIAEKFPIKSVSMEIKIHLRSAEASGDEASMVSVVDEVLAEYCETGKEEIYNIILLQPTSPIRSKRDIRRLVEMLNDTNESVALVSHAQIDIDDLYIKYEEKSEPLALGPELGLELVERRQSRQTELLALNGSIYGFPVQKDGNRNDISECFRKPKNLIVSELKRTVEIDNPIDFVVGRTLARYYADQEDLSLINIG
jgi:CMP-N,N'-diacetyllegionaminic acid synthase